jgi:spermidine synthase
MTALPTTGANRALFVATILTGSFLLFLIQPMVARMALPRLGGAPAVWNSAMLVYQALLLGGYAYAHWLGRFAIRRQAAIHLALLLAAALWLPVGLADMVPAAEGQEALWVPLFLAVSIGPIFFMVAAQAPLLQRWFAADANAGDPYALYAASNLGSFAGLIAYPLLLEPRLSIAVQGWGWTAGYALLVLLVLLTARARWRAGMASTTIEGSVDAAALPRPTARRMLLWLILSAVPSGLMLSTTTHLTTDVFAMPLMWVIPLGLYLLSFVFAFSDRRAASEIMSLIAPPVLLIAGGVALISVGNGSLVVALASLVMLFLVAVALHARLYRLRPEPAQLTLFYLVMSAGGVLGGIFAALVAPLLFDWVYEHPVLILAAAALLPLPALIPWASLLRFTAIQARIAAALLFAAACMVAAMVASTWSGLLEGPMIGLVALLWALGVLLTGWRWAYVGVLALTMLAIGGIDTIKTSLAGDRTRSYFGVYTVRDYPTLKQRTLAHGTTLHGLQRTDAAKRLEPTTYYGRTSGVGLALEAVPGLVGPNARIGIVGLGTGTLSCYKQPGQRWHIYEIDPAMVTIARDSGAFTFLPTCAPDAVMHIGDARLKLATAPRAGLDLLAVDAFSSDSIPLHLLTAEAIAIYERALAKDGILLIHISNRFFDLEPVLDRAARDAGLSAAVRIDDPSVELTYDGMTGSSWVAMARDPARLRALTGTVVPRERAKEAGVWAALKRDDQAQRWTDDYASVLPIVQWDQLLGRKD